MPRLPLIVTAVVCLILGLALGWLRLRHHDSNLGEQIIPAKMVDFTLVGPDGKLFHLADLRGRVGLLYFGYTFCPDVCPTELGFLVRLMKALGPAADGIQPVFVSVDTERDTPAKLAEFTPLFHPRLLGLSGDAKQMRAAADVFGVYYDKVVPSKAAPGFYLMNHSSTTFVIDRQGRLTGKLDSHMELDEALTVVRGIL